MCADALAPPACRLWAAAAAGRTKTGRARGLRRSRLRRRRRARRRSGKRRATRPSRSTGWTAATPTRSDAAPRGAGAGNGTHAGILGARSIDAARGHSTGRRRAAVSAMEAHCDTRPCPRHALHICSACAACCWQLQEAPHTLCPSLPMSHCSAGRAPLPLHKSGDGSPCVLPAGEPQTAQKPERIRSGRKEAELKAAAPSDSLEAGDMVERAQRGVA